MLLDGEKSPSLILGVKIETLPALQLIESEWWGTANAHIFQSVICTYNSLQTDCVEIQLTLSAKTLVLANNGLYKDTNGCVLDFCIWYRTFHCTNNAGDEEFWK